MKTLEEIRHGYVRQQCSDKKGSADLDEMINNELIKAKSFIDCMSEVLQCISEIAGVEEGDVAGLINWAESKRGSRKKETCRCKDTADMFDIKNEEN